MGLQNWVGISLEQVAPVKETVKRLLDSAARHIAGPLVSWATETVIWLGMRL
jgi:hypothetical protein